MNLSELMPNQDDQIKFLAQLKRHEGERLAAYLDTVGVLTVGVGHNCQAHPVCCVEKVGDKISKELSDELFYVDVNSHVDHFSRRCPWVSELNAPRQAVLFNMAFNLGIPGIMNFKNTLSMIEAQDYDRASTAMLASKWASQVGDFPPGSPQAKRVGRPGRAWELATQMKLGEWQ